MNFKAKIEYSNFSGIRLYPNPELLRFLESRSAWKPTYCRGHLGLTHSPEGAVATWDDEFTPVLHFESLNKPKVFFELEALVFNKEGKRRVFAELPPIHLLPWVTDERSMTKSLAKLEFKERLSSALAAGYGHQYVVSLTPEWAIKLIGADWNYMRRQAMIQERELRA